MPLRRAIKIRSLETFLCAALCAKSKLVLSRLVSSRVVSCAIAGTDRLDLALTVAHMQGAAHIHLVVLIRLEKMKTFIFL